MNVLNSIALLIRPNILISEFSKIGSSLNYVRKNIIEGSKKLLVPLLSGMESMAPRLILQKMI